MAMTHSTQIIATLGPASSTPQIIEQLINAGANIFRLNFSHGSLEGHQANIDTVRHLARQLNVDVKILQDLPGPKLRIGRFENDAIDITPGQQFTLDLNEDLGNEHRVQLPHPEILQALKVGSDVLLNDGNVKLKVMQTSASQCVTTVVYGTKLSNNKGVNIPDIILPIDAITAKDQEYIQFGLRNNVDYIALSFVQSGHDVQMGRNLIGHNAKIITKIEKPFAVKNLTEIVALSDGIMVARGDLGVEMNIAQLPVIQRHIITACKAAKKPVFVATQMLESMITNPTPTRAEVNDIACAVYAYADAVMLSAESASGAYPVESVAMMKQVIHFTEIDRATV